MELLREMESAADATARVRGAQSRVTGGLQGNQDGENEGGGRGGGGGAGSELGVGGGVRGGWVGQCGLGHWEGGGGGRRGPSRGARASPIITPCPTPAANTRAT